jgi:hypothetical protein
MTRNLQARDNFKKGDIGCATGHQVSRTIQPGRPAGSFRVTALQDVKAGTNGWFEANDQSSLRPPAEALSRGASSGPDMPDRLSRRSGSEVTRPRTK